MYEMSTLEINTGHGEISLVGNKVYEGHDYYVKANAPLSDVKVILFFDSRGVSKNWESSLLKKLLEYFESSSYLIVARPLELTTWPTLYNFLGLNRLSPELLITNIGIVDFTPKKYSLCQLMVEQVMFDGEAGVSSILPLETYQLSNGQEEMLFSVDYSEQYKQHLKSFFFNVPILAIKTPAVDPGINIERIRPASFFTQLHKTNKFIDMLGCTSIDLGCFDNRLTYDAVHWTREGNELVFDKIISHL